MNIKTFANDEKAQQKTIKNYYRFQAKIYDLTRWSFLFGRNNIIQKFDSFLDEFSIVAEIGCGTGHNLVNLARNYPFVTLLGIDVSEDMILKAKRKLVHYENAKVFYQIPYDKDFQFNLHQPSLILFSYVLSMMNPQWEELIQKAYNDLDKGMHIAVVDFHYSKHSWFRKHMSEHHVRMEKHILPFLEDLFTP
ncbi:MAG: methyltransferase, partial [Bacteroidota bacterium]